MILFVFDTLGKILYEAGYHLSARENQMKVSEKSLNSFALQTHFNTVCTEISHQPIFIFHLFRQDIFHLHQMDQSPIFYRPLLHEYDDWK